MGVVESLLELDGKATLAQRYFLTSLNLLKREKNKKRGIRGKMLNAGWDHAYLLELLGVEPKDI